MKKVKIYGAGSIGNHLAQASRQMGWSVDMCDIDSDALDRTKNDIYPTRYGKWDEDIKLYSCDEVPSGGYDMVIVGTPPDSHMKLALSAINEGAKTVLVEKPFCTPDLTGAQEVYDAAKKTGCSVFVGYDHAIGKSAMRMSNMLKQQQVGKPLTLDVEFREYWGGIFMAHPWLDGPSDTYLGYWKKGGGACGEHSHAINLWQSLSHFSGMGRIVEVSATMEYVNDGTVDYDSICLLQVRTETGFVGRIVQDVITQPTRKWARAQCEDGYIEWYCGHKPGLDTVVCGTNDNEITKIDISKTRPDDFLQEMKHIEATLASDDADSPISMTHGLDTMLVVSAAHMSSRENRTVKIDYSQGYTQEALSLVK